MADLLAQAVLLIKIQICILTLHRDLAHHLRGVYTKINVMFT